MLFLFGAGIPHFILEVAILICPLVEIRRLHLPTSKKLAVAGMFTSGVLVCCSAMGSIIHTVALNNKRADIDLTWDSIDDQIWAVCDVNLASLASMYPLSVSSYANCDSRNVASLPLLRPIFRSFGGLFSSLGSSQSPSQAYANQQTVPTYTNSASRRIRTRDDSDSDSVIELADAAGGISGRTPSAFSTKAYTLQNTSPRTSRIEPHGGIHIQEEFVVSYGNS
jgi:hypothetical protein